MNTTAIYITGTDTGVGKTKITGFLARFFQERGRNVAPQKWIQTGCDQYPEDINTHLKLMGKTSADYTPFLTDMCPYTFSLPASPHLAADAEQRDISTKQIMQSFQRLCANFDLVIVEGAGGVMVPYAKNRLMIDIVKKLNLPTILVIDNKLGAINHSLLSIEALKARGLSIIGLIFTKTTDQDNELILKDNIQTISSLSGCPVLCDLPYLKNDEELYRRFNHEMGQRAPIS